MKIDSADYSVVMLLRLLQTQEALSVLDLSILGYFRNTAALQPVVNQLLSANTPAALERRANTRNMFVFSSVVTLSHEF